MRRIYLTFSGFKYHDTTRRIVEDGPRFGADEVWVADDVWLKNCRPGYWDRMRWFREHPGVRGVDFFCFKPFVILDTLRRLEPGDILLYSDADTYPIADLSPLYDICRRDGGVCLFAARGCLNGVWTKRDALAQMGCDAPEFREPWQTVARFMLFEKGAAFPAERFLGQWLGYAANPLINTFDPSVLLPEHPGFIENRCEQSVLSCLRLMYSLPIYREACSFGCWSEPPMPCERGEPGHQTFEQEGRHSYRPGYAGDESEGSAFRNLNE